ncbi:MAG: c-type cytochrome [Azonexus sp.]
MRSFIVLAVFGLALGHAAQADEVLAKAKNCTTCHGIGNKIVGPSYKDIAAKRASEKGAEAALTAKIKNGSKDEWGQVPMPPNQVSDAEAAKLARWVLSFK